MRICLLSLIVFLGGCVYVPPVWDAGDEIYYLDDIESGVTTKEQVLAKLGEPDIELDDGASYWYTGRKGGGAGMLVVIFGFDPGSIWTVTIDFDENDVVSKVQSFTTETDWRTYGQAGTKEYFSMQLKKACDGDKLAQFVVAKTYDSGEGIERDKIEAYKWYSLAASEWTVASEFKDRLVQQMTLSEIIDAEWRVNGWRANFRPECDSK